jgi:hypothetical protein
MDDKSDKDLNLSDIISSTQDLHVYIPNRTADRVLVSSMVVTFL